MRSTFWKACAITLASYTASGCSQQQIQVRDYAFYGDKGKYGATKVHSLATHLSPERLYKSQWDEIRIGMVCTQAANITDMQANIDKLCSLNPAMCWYVQEDLNKIRDAVSAIERAAKE